MIKFIELTLLVDLKGETRHVFLNPEKIGYIVHNSVSGLTEVIFENGESFIQVNESTGMILEKIEALK